MRKNELNWKEKLCVNCGVQFQNPRNRFCCSRKCSNTQKTGRKRLQSVEATEKARERLKKIARERNGKSYKEIYGERAVEEVKKRFDKRKPFTKRNLKWWNRGRKEKYRDLHGGKEYVEWRTKIFERDSYTCQSCGERGGYLQAHHLKSWKNYPEKRYEVPNGVTLHKECHKKWNRVQRIVEKLIFNRT